MASLLIFCFIRCRCISSK